VSGTAIDSESGEGLGGIELYFSDGQGQVYFLYTEDDGSFQFNNVSNGPHLLEFHYYEPVIINGDYYLYTEYPDTINVDGTDVDGIVFSIPPHHPDYNISGTLYDASTNLPLSDQNISLRLDFASHSGFFFAWVNDDGTYSFGDSIPDWTYNFHVFENNYYYGDEVEIVIDTAGPQEITMDFYLQPKDGATVSGTLYDIETGEPIPIANRTIRLSAIYPEYAETDSNGNFTFVNVPPGYYTNMTVRTEDTAYINCNESVIYDFTVPDSGVSGVEIYQQKFESIHIVTVDDPYYEVGTTKTLRFSLVHIDDEFGSVWGVELVLPPELAYVSHTNFYEYQTGDITFDKIDDCADSTHLIWEGYHYVFGGYNVGNLNILNDSVYADVTLEFGDNMGESSEIFFKVFYGLGGCYILQPFSFGNIELQNASTITSISEADGNENTMIVYPNPVSENVNFKLSLEDATEGTLSIYNYNGQLISTDKGKSLVSGDNYLELNTSGFKNGLYFYTFSSTQQEYSGKFIVSH